MIGLGAARLARSTLSRRGTRIRWRPLGRSVGNDDDADRVVLTHLANSSRARCRQNIDYDTFLASATDDSDEEDDGGL